MKNIYLVKIRLNRKFYGAVAFLIALTISMSLKAQTLKYATGGNGANKGILWFDFTGVSLAAGGSQTISYNANGIAITVTIDQISFSGTTASGTISTTRLVGYKSGTWQGDGLDELYNIGGTGTSNTLANALSTNFLGAGSGIDANFRIRAYASFNGTPTELALIFASAEDDGAANEYTQGTTNGSSWKLFERAVQTTNGHKQIIFSNSNLTARMRMSTGVANGSTPANVALLHTSKSSTSSTDQLSATLQFHAGGGSAQAIGLMVSQDFGDAASSYGKASQIFYPVLSTGANHPGISGGTVYLASTGTNSGTPVIYPGVLSEPNNPILGAVGADGDPNNTDFFTALADGDDNQGTDDEDIFPSTGMPSLDYNATNYSVTVPVSKTSTVPTTYLYAWIDFNRDGIFSASERQTTNIIANGASSATFTWALPSDKSAGLTFARFRLSVTDPLTITDNPATLVDERSIGNLIGGEIEDHRLNILARISGNVFNDTDGLAAPGNTIDGTAIQTPSGTQLHANLFTAGAAFITTVPVNSSGQYEFTGITASATYQVTISSTPASSSSTLAGSVGLPSGWMNVGEKLGMGIGGDGAADGHLIVTVGTANVTNANFGIQQRPIVGNGSSTVANQPGTTQVNVPLTTFTNVNPSTDSAPGTIESILITAIPTGASSIVINGTTYGNGGIVFPAGGVSIETDGNGLPIAGTTITVDPTAIGVTTVTISFVAVDNAGTRSVNTGVQGTAVLNLTSPIGISGTVFNDANGNAAQDGGEAATNGDSTNLTAYLVDGSGNVVSSSVVSNAGAYSFPNAAPGTAYFVILSNTLGIPFGNPVTASVSTGWVNTGESFGINNVAGTGIDPTSSPGVIAVTTPAAGSVTGVNFGIQQTPTADPVTLTNISNSTFSSTPPTGFPVLSNHQSAALNNPNLDPLSGNDPEDCPTTKCSTGSTFVIESINTSNTILYYDFGGSIGIVEMVPGTSTATIANFDPTKLVIYGAVGSGGSTDPFEFTYQLVDAAGAMSEPATYSVSTGSPLPVTLISFTAKKGETYSALLNWTTTEEINSEKFEVENSIDGKNWKVIGTVAAKGESKEIATYSYTHTTPVMGENLYRLRMADIDGTFAYSRINSLNFTVDLEATLYPNPTSDKINLNGVDAGDVTKVSVFAMDGKTVYAANKLNNGEIDVRNFPDGLYVVSITLKNGTTQIAKVVILR